MIQHDDLIQGEPAWHQFRLVHDGASEAAAMLGLSKKTTRSELLKIKHTGIGKEFTDWVQANILDYGHAVEAMARPHVNALIGDELYPSTCSDGRKSASCDGLTMDERIAFEHKQWNESLATQVSVDIVPDDHMPQCQQILMVTGAEKLIFVVSDGTPENMVHTWVFPDQAWFARIDAGWKQFHNDLEAYVPVEVVDKPTGKTMEALPALRVEVTGMVTASNLAAYKEHALAVFAGINRELTTDQHFADAAKTVKWCEDVEGRLEATKQHALSQTETIDALFRTIDEISAEARQIRLDLDKLVDKRKAEIKLAAITKARDAYDAHVAELVKETGGPWIVLPAPNFVEAAKNKRTVASLQDAIDTALANGKIAADASAKSIRASLACLKEDGAGFEFLFADKLALIGKPLDDLKLLIKSRIAEHQAAEAAKEEAARLEREQAQAATQSAIGVTKMVAVLDDADGAPVMLVERVPPVIAQTAVHHVQYASPDLRLGQICERLGFTVTADFLRQLGFAPAGRDRAAVLYHEADYPKICRALITHIRTVCPTA